MCLSDRRDFTKEEIQTLTDAEEKNRKVKMPYKPKDKGIHTLSGRPVKIEKKWAMLSKDDKDNPTVFRINACGVMGEIVMLTK